MMLEWHQFLDERNHTILSATDGTRLFTIRRCGPNGRNFALRVNGQVRSIGRESDLKAEAEGYGKDAEQKV